MTAPQVSVVLPTRNRPPLMMQALGSALSQEGVEVEVIVVDDASSDDTPAVLSGVDDRRLTVLRHEEPKGPAAARNAGIDRARGDWVAFLDDDDFFAPGKLHIQIEDADRLGSSFSYTGRIEIDDSGSVIQQRLMSEHPSLAVGLLEDNLVGGPSAVIVRSDLLAEIGGFDERLPPLEDWDLWIRAVAAGTVAVRREPLYAYRRHPQNLWVTAAARIPDAFEVMREKHDRAAAEAGIEFGSVWIARSAAARDLADGRRLRAAGRLLKSAASERNLREAARALLTLGGDRSQRLGMSAMARVTPRPDWLDDAMSDYPERARS
jgi:glycosyltransferase involved in cell wall biosynthesis